MAETPTLAAAPREATASAPARVMGPAAILFLLRLAGAGLGFLAALLLARVLGVGGYGIYLLALAWAGFLTLGA